MLPFPGKPLYFWIDPVRWPPRLSEPITWYLHHTPGSNTWRACVISAEHDTDSGLRLKTHQVEFWFLSEFPISTKQQTRRNNFPEHPVALLKQLHLRSHHAIDNCTLKLQNYIQWNKNESAKTWICQNKEFSWSSLSGISGFLFGVSCLYNTTHSDENPKNLLFMNASRIYCFYLRLKRVAPEQSWGWCMLRVFPSSLGSKMW